jgi:hypothetical protein
MGNVPIVLKDSGTVNEITNVLYVPDATVNILSVNSTVKREYCMFFSKGRCKIFDQKGCKVIGRQVATAKEVRGIYELEVDSPQHDQQKCFVTENTHPDKNIHNGQEFWHCRLAHLNIGDMLKLKQKNCGLTESLKSSVHCEEVFKMRRDSVRINLTK